MSSTTLPTSPLSRRALTAGAAWSVPALVLASAAPAMAASGEEPVLTEFSTDIASTVAACTTDGTSRISLTVGTTPLATDPERGAGDGFILASDGVRSTYTITSLTYLVALPTELGVTRITGKIYNGQAIPETAQAGWYGGAVSTRTELLDLNHATVPVPEGYTLYEFTYAGALTDLPLDSYGVYPADIRTTINTEAVFTVVDDACREVKKGAQVYPVYSGFLATATSGGTTASYSTFDGPFNSRPYRG